MHVSAVEVVGPKKKAKGKKRAETVAVAVNTEPETRKRKTRRDKTLYKNRERALKMVAKFPNQSLKEKEGLLWCEACNKNISFEKGGDTKQHLYGVQKAGEKAEVAFMAMSEETKLKLRHYRNLVGIAAAAKERNAVELATDVFREEIWKKSGEKESMKGSTLPVAATADRVEVLKNFWRKAFL